MATATVEAVYRPLAKAIQTAEIRELFASGGSEASGMPPAEMERVARQLSERWGVVIRDVGVSLD
jgi:tripartite-type tricarboxylate transporter receptor subunit TctC